MLELNAIQAYYGNLQVLKDVSLNVGEGEIISLIGANGAGKSTTLMSICGVVPPRTGEIRFLGKRINNLNPYEIASLGISQVPEGRRIFPQLTVSENLDMGAYLRRDPAGIKKDLSRIYELFPILAKRLHQQGGTLSGGEQQMLAISRALMARPRLLLLDEPSLGLAPIYVRLIFDIIQRINAEEGTAIFLVEQNANMALKIAHRGYVMETGKIVLAGNAATLRDDEGVRNAYLGL
jgi:branched-chain amino acid transport system ATP-binding protein